MGFVCRISNVILAKIEKKYVFSCVQVLRDSGQMVNLVVKRRVVLPSPPEPQNIKVSLYKNKKKEGKMFCGTFFA